MQILQCTCRRQTQCTRDGVSECRGAATDRGAQIRARTLRKQRTEMWKIFSQFGFWDRSFGLSLLLLLGARCVVVFFSSFVSIPYVSSFLFFIISV